MSTVGAVILVVVLTAAIGFELFRRRTDGRLRPASASGDVAGATSDAPTEAGFPAAELGIELGRRATLVQFSTVFCQPCRATRLVLSEVAEMVDGVVAVDVDAESHLDHVRRLRIMRTPTVFVLDSTGAVRQRAVGTPRKADVIAAIGALEGVAD